jgi:hypothetical protein
MQPILAESVPHRGRALVLAAVLAAAAALAGAVAIAPRSHHERWHRHHHLSPIGKCTYVYAVH